MWCPKFCPRSWPDTLLEVLLLLLLHLTLFRGATGDRGRICHAARSHNAWPGGLTSFSSRNGYVYSMAFFPLHSKCRKSAERRPNKFRPYRESSMLRCRTKPLATKTKNVVSLPGGLPPPGPPGGLPHRVPKPWESMSGFVPNYGFVRIRMPLTFAQIRTEHRLRVAD